MNRAFIPPGRLARVCRIRELPVGAPCDPGLPAYVVRSEPDAEGFVRVRTLAEEQEARVPADELVSAPLDVVRPRAPLSPGPNGEAA